MNVYGNCYWRGRQRWEPSTKKMQINIIKASILSKYRVMAKNESETWVSTNLDCPDDFLTLKYRTRL